MNRFLSLSFLAIVVLGSGANAAPDIYINNVTASTFDVAVRGSAAQSVLGYDIYMQVVRQSGQGTLTLNSASNPAPAVFPLDSLTLGDESAAIDFASGGALTVPDYYYVSYYAGAASTLQDTKLFRVNYTPSADANGAFQLKFRSEPDYAVTNDLVDASWSAVPGTTFTDGLITIPVPEPTSMLVLVCAAGLGLRRRR